MKHQDGYNTTSMVYGKHHSFCQTWICFFRWFLNGFYHGKSPGNPPFGSIVLRFSKHQNSKSKLLNGMILQPNSKQIPILLPSNFCWPSPIPKKSLVSCLRVHEMVAGAIATDWDFETTGESDLCSSVVWVCSSVCVGFLVFFVVGAESWKKIVWVFSWGGGIVGELLGLGCSCTHNDCSLNRFFVHFLHPKKSTKGEISGVSSVFRGCFLLVLDYQRT